MKKLFSLLTLALLTMSAWAASNVEFDFTSGYNNAEAVTSVTKDGVTITFDQGTGNNAPAWYSSGSAIRVYAGGTLTVAAEQNITSITFTFGTGDGTNEITSNVGTYVEPTWTGEAKAVTFTVGGTSKHRRFAKVVVTFDGETPGPGPDPEPESNVFALVTDMADLAAGDKFVLVGYNDDNSAVVMGASRGNNYGIANVTVEDNKVVTNDATVITLEANGENWNLKTDKGYLYAASSKNNYLKAENAVDEDGNANAAISIDGDSAIIVFQGTNERNVVRYNRSSSLFSCYGATNSQFPVYIFKATGEQVVIVEVAEPVFTPAHNTKFLESLEVSLTCEDADATIYYTTDSVYQVYNGPITLTETTTVKAYAELNGVQSDVVSAKYYKLVEVANLAEANKLENKIDFIFRGNVVAVYQNGSNLWVKDETGYGLIYGNQVPEIEVGATLKKDWDAQSYLFRDMIHEFKYPNNVEADANVPVQEIVATEYAEAELTTDNINERVIVKGLTLTAGEDPLYLYTANNMVIYNQFGIEYPAIEEGKTYDVEGMVSYYDNAVQIMPIAITEGSAPEFIRGDVDGDGEVGIADVTALIDILVNATPAPAAADCDLDGEAGIADVTALIDYLLSGNW
jgi:hypothetical protein